MPPKDLHAFRQVDRTYQSVKLGIKGLRFIRHDVSYKPVVDASRNCLTLFDLLEAVHDHETLWRSRWRLPPSAGTLPISRRTIPQRYMLNGAHGWANGDIPAFLEAACEYFGSVPDGEPVPEPSLEVFAEILWCGKIIE